MLFDVDKVYFGRLNLIKEGERPKYSMSVAHNHVMDFTLDELLGLQDHINSLVEDVKRNGIDVTAERPSVTIADIHV